MATPIGALRAELSASIAKFKEDMGKAANQVRNFASDAEKQGKRLERVGKKLSFVLTAPIVAFAYKSVQAAKDSAKAFNQVEAALASTGNQSGRTAEQLLKSSKALESISLFDGSDILTNATANLLRFGNVQGEVFDRAQQAIIDYAARTGTDLSSATTLIGKALNQPATAATTLKKAIGDLGKPFEEYIKNLVTSGRGVEAQNALLDKLAEKFGGAAKAARDADPFASMNQSIKELMEAAGPLIVEFLKPLTEIIKGLADAFKELSPTMQKVVIYGALFAAALGPLLVVGGNVLKLVSFLAPAIFSLGSAIAAAIGISLGALLGWAAALAAAVAAVVVFWKSIKLVLSGNFKEAWTEAKKSAKGLVDDITGLFKKKPAEMPVVVLPPAGGGGQEFNLPDQVENATKKFTEALRGMDQKISGAFDKLELPKSIAAANDLNTQIDEFVKEAQDAGVKTDKFAGSIGALRARIEELKKAGLAEEAKKFGREVDQSDIAVRRFAFGSLDPLSDRLNSVDTAYQGLKDKIESQIEDNRVLAQSNDEAAAAMERLKKQLVDLETAHQLATDAAREQWAAENRLRDLETQAANLQTSQQIRDLRQASNGPIGEHQKALQDIQDKLDESRIQAAAKLQDLENQRAEAVRVNDEDEARRLSSQIELQTQLKDLVDSTTAAQLDAATRIGDAFSQFTDDLSSQLSDMISNWSFDLDGLRNVFADLAKQLFLKPFLQSATDSLSGGIKGLLGGISGGAGGGGGGLFAGLFADGGFVPPGQWAIAGEHGPEPVFGGRSGLAVVSNDTASQRMGGVNQTFNVYTPDANSFRKSERQIQRSAKQGLGL